MTADYKHLKQDAIPYTALRWLFLETAKPTEQKIIVTIPKTTLINLHWLWHNRKLTSFIFFIIYFPYYRDTMDGVLELCPGHKHYFNNRCVFLPQISNICKQCDEQSLKDIKNRFQPKWNWFSHLQTIQWKKGKSGAKKPKSTCPAQKKLNAI